MKKKASLPPPPPPPVAKHYGFDDPRPSDVSPHVPVAQRPTVPLGATHYEFKCCNGSTICGPLGGVGDYSTMRGSISFGRLRYDTDFVRMGDNELDNLAALNADEIAQRSTENGPKGPPPPPKPVAKVPRAPGAPKGEGVCAFIDDLVMKGGKKASEIAALVVAKFPGRDLAATISTVKVRPSHCKKKGLVPPPFVKE